MKRTTASSLALVILVGLTLLTWRLADSGAPPWALAAVALMKVTVIGVVFLELLRSRAIWAALFITLVATVLGGAAWLIPL